MTCLRSLKKTLSRLSDWASVVLLFFGFFPQAVVRSPRFEQQCCRHHHQGEQPSEPSTLSAAYSALDFVLQFFVLCSLWNLNFKNSVKKRWGQVLVL